MTLPFVLLLLDHWPLGRLELKTKNSKLKILLLLVWEKLPFLALAAASCTLTCLAQQHAIKPLVEVTLPERLVNGVMSYALYAAKFIWPANLAVFYPWVAHWPWPQFLAAVAFVVLVSGWAWRCGWQRPWLATGWAW